MVFTKIARPGHVLHHFFSVGDSLLIAMGLLLQVVVLKILAAADAGARLPFPSLDIPSPLLLPSSSVSQESADIPLTTF